MTAVITAGGSLRYRTSQGRNTMAHECGCHAGQATTIPVDRDIEPGDVVADVARRNPAALEVLKDKGINHCCGAHLTLKEAAAAAGVPLDELLATLNESRKAPA